MHRITPYFLWLFLLLSLFNTPSQADLGLDSSNFGGKQVSGEPIKEDCTDADGCGSTSAAQTDSTTHNEEEGTVSGEPGINAPPCQKNEGNGKTEGNFCPMCATQNPGASKDATTESCNSDACVATNSYVNVFTRQYQDDLVDLEVKVAGGHARVLRLYAEGQWQFEHEFNRIRPTDNPATLKKANLTYTKGADGLYHFKTFTLQQLEQGYRWQSKHGDYVVYDQQGRMIETGSRLGVLTRYTYQDDRLVSINDRANTPMFQFSYDAQGKIIKASDTHNRSVAYAWNQDLLNQVTDVLGHSTRYHYSNEGRLTAKADDAGRKFFITYYQSGAVASVLSREGGGLRFSYAPHQARVTSSMGRVQEFWFSPDGETERVSINGHTIRREEVRPGGRVSIDEIGNRITKTYDANDNLVKQEFGDGSFLSFTYDSRNNLLVRTDELGIETRYTYNDQGQPLTVRKAYHTVDEQTTTYQYDASGNLISTTLNLESGPAVTRYQYDDRDNQIATIDALGGKTTASYDFLGNVLNTTNAAALTTSMRYDAKGQLLSITAQDGRSLSTTYDAAGRKTAQTDSAGGSTSFAYDFQDNRTQVTDALGGITKYNFDKDNRLTKTIDAEGNYQVFFYNPDNNQIGKTVDGSGNAIEITYRGFSDCGTCAKTFQDKPVLIKYPTFSRYFKYNDRGLVIEQRDVAGTIKTTTTSKYDQAGRLLSTTDPSGATTKYSYDNLGRVTSTTDPLEQITRFVYDRADNLIAVIDANKQETRFVYDALGRKIKEIRPLGNSISTDYDTLGRLLASSDSGGNSRTYQYDPKTGRLASYNLKKGDAATTVTLSYDNRGNLASYDDGTSKARYEYDLLGQRLQETVHYGAITTSQSTSYYKNGLKKSHTGPDGLSRSYSYTPSRQLASIEIDTYGAIRFDDYQWLRAQKITAPGLEQQDSYDGLLRLTSRVNGQQNLRYTYDLLGNITSKKTGDQALQYSYDPLQRLTRVEEKATTQETFTYDPVGNRLAAKEQQYRYDNGNQLLAVNGTSYRYDLNGNTTLRQTAGTSESFGYDPANQLTEVTKDGQTIRYSYDPFHRRIGKEVAGQKTWYVYSEEGLAAELDQNGKLIASYTYKPGSTWSTDPLLQTRGGQHYLYHNDHLGTPQQLTDVQGTVVWAATYDAFGAATVTTATIANNLRFPGQYLDAETGLHYNWHRFYSPDLGRYITADPIGLGGGLNLYAYVQGNSANLIDPWGLAGTRSGPRNPGTRSYRAPGSGQNPYAEMQYFDLLRQIREINPNYSVLREESRPIDWNDVALLREDLGRLNRCEPNNSPPNLSPSGAGATGALREALRNNGIPTSQQPIRIEPNYDRNGNLQPGWVLVYEVPAPGGGTREISIRNDSEGHFFGPADPQNRGPHFNDPNEGHYDY